MRNVVLKKSKIHNQGVLADRDFNKGETILIIDDSDVVIDPSKLTKNNFNLIAII